MRPRMILHVGPHKTGSTYLQRRLVQNQKSLLKQGLLIPNTGWVPCGHHKLVDVLMGWIPATEHCSLDSLKSEVANSELILITSENFVLLKSQQLQAFRDAFKNFDIDVVFFLRHPVSVWPSHWQEVIKHGSDITFAEYLLSVLGHSAEIDVSATFPLRQIRRLSNIFGIDRLKIVSYENIRDNGGDLFEFFLRTLLGGTDYEFEGEADFVNVSLPPEQVELIRLLNALHAMQHGKMASYLLRHAYLQSIEGVSPDVPYQTFVSAFEANMKSLRISSDMPIIRDIFDGLTDEFRSVIINRHSDVNILMQPVGERSVQFGPRDWIFRSDQIGYIREIYTTLQLKLESGD